MLKKVLTSGDFNIIPLDAVGKNVPIFARRSGQLVGMVTCVGGKGWILSLGGELGATGYHNTRRECIESCLEFHYDFVIDTE